MWTFVNLHAIEPTRSRRQRRVDGVRRPTLDFHTGQRHVANRDGLPDRVARRVARAASTPAHGDAVFRGVHTILPETTNFPVKLACLPSSTYGDVVWLQPKSADFDPSKVNRAPRPAKSRA